MQYVQIGRRLAVVSGFTEARGAPLVGSHSSPAAKTIRDGRCGRFAAPSASSHRVQSAVAVAGARSATGAIAVVLIGRGGIPPACSNGNGKPLHYSPLTGPLTGIHAVIHGEVAADHVGASGGSVLRQLIRLVFDICGVLPVVHTNSASVAIASAEGLEERFWPVTALAEAYGMG